MKVVFFWAVEKLYKTRKTCKSGAKSEEKSVVLFFEEFPEEEGKKDQSENKKKAIFSEKNAPQPIFCIG